MDIRYILTCAVGIRGNLYNVTHLGVKLDVIAYCFKIFCLQIRNSY